MWYTTKRIQSKIFVYQHSSGWCHKSLTLQVHSEESETRHRVSGQSLLHHENEVAA